MTKLDYTQGIELLAGAHSVAICGHVNPDGDCLGSTLALTLGLRSLGYEVTPLLATREHPRLYDFLEGYGDFVSACDYHVQPDVFILVDVPSVSRSGDGEHVFKRAKKTLVIDHHQGDAAFADVGYVDNTAAAAGMLVWDFLEQTGVEMTPQIATCCYTALVTDTGRFQFQNADSRAFMAAARILCPTPFVLNSPPCPVMESIFTSSSFNKMSRPIFNVTSDAYKCDRIKFASSK